MVAFDLFNSVDDYQNALGGIAASTQDFEGFADGENLDEVEFLPGVFVTSNLPQVEAFQGSGDQELFGFGGSVRQQGNAFYDINFNQPYNAVGFDIEAFNPETPGPAVLEIFFGNDIDLNFDGEIDLNTSTDLDLPDETIEIFPTNATETEPIFFGIVADTPIERIRLNEGPEIGGSGNEEIALDNFAIADTLTSTDEFVIRASEIPGLQLLDEPLQVADGIWFLGTGPSPSELQLLAPTNVDAANTTNTDQLQSGGELGLNLDGSGLTVGVWEVEGWVRDTHQEFTGRVTFGDGDDDNRNFTDHATHVAGTIGAKGEEPDARGMANQVKIISYNASNAVDEMEAAADLIVASNHSYSKFVGWETRMEWDNLDLDMNDEPDPVDTWLGEDLSLGGMGFFNQEDTDFGKYTNTTRQLDKVLQDNPNLLSVWAASNDRNDDFTDAHGDNTYVGYFSSAPVEGTSVDDGYYLVSTNDFEAPAPDGNKGAGYDSLPPAQVAKNTLVVGAVQDVPNQNTTTEFSSWGPTDDGRVKPDVMGNGDDLLSSGARANDAYFSTSGTSMAAPNVTGTAVLLIEHYQNLFYDQPRSATTKGLLIHTAVDAGNDGPDYSFGWGLVNAADAANFLSNAAAPYSSFLLEENTYNGTEQTITVQSDGTNPLKATIVWTDPAPKEEDLPPDGLDVPTPVLVNDLDLWITGPDGTHFPWTLDPANPAKEAADTAANHVDNVEQVLIDAPIAGEYTIHIGHTGSSFTQDFSLLVSTEELFNVINGTNDDDRLEGTPNKDLINGFDGNDTLIGKESDDRLNGGEDDDLLQGDSGNDTLKGGDNRDTLDGGTGNDILKGEDGDDVMDAGPGNDELDGGEDRDEMSGGDGDDILNGGDNRDTLDGGEGQDILNGENGDDLMKGGAGDDELNGGEDRDEMFGDEDNDTLNGGNSNDLLDGGDGNDILNGENDDDVMEGGAGDDVLNGGADRDELSGGAGNDTLDGGEGEDQLLGGDGNDIFRLPSDEDTDIILDYQDGFDKFELVGLTFEDLTATDDGTQTFISITETEDVLVTLMGVVDASVIGLEDFVY